MTTSEVTVAKINDLRIGQLKQISVNNSDILLARLSEEKFYATAPHCTHFGAPLEKGVLVGERLACPWHHACFNMTTGDYQEPPALDSLPSFPVRVEGENIIVELPEKIPESRTPNMAKHNPSADSRVFAIIGTGPAGMFAAETLRQQGFQGQIFLITREERLPYDRTKLSKKYLQGKVEEDALPQRSCEFYQENDIELRCGKAVTNVDANLKTITFEDNSVMSYDSLLVATGGRPKRLNVPGIDLDNIFTLRQPDDVNHILETAETNQRVVVVGSSFIGMETAASLSQQGLSVTVISPDSVPFEKTLGQKVGKMFQDLHESHGVSFCFQTKATQFEGNGKVEGVILENGEKIPADLVIIGIGVQPVTDFLSGVNIDEKDNSVIVNEYLQAGKDIYAAGDIARFPYAPLGKLTRIEHWRLAAQHGRIAAHNMAGNQVKFSGIPFFWSGQFDLKLRYAGYAEDWDEIIFDGDVNSREFLAFYIKNNQVLAVTGCGRDRDVTAITELMRLQQIPNVDQIRNQSINWVEHIHQF